MKLSATLSNAGRVPVAMSPRAPPQNEKSLEAALGSQWEPTVDQSATLCAPKAAGAAQSPSPETFAVAHHGSASLACPRALLCPRTQRLIEIPWMQDDGLVYDKFSLSKEEGEVAVACRLFKDILSLYNQHAADREGFTMALGERLICPISCGPLISGILAADGYTYEKCNLDRALRASECSPYTRVPIRFSPKIPHRSLAMLQSEMGSKDFWEKPVLSLPAPTVVLHDVVMGGVFSGGMSHGLREGFGIERHQDGQFVSGTFSAGRLSGQATVVTARSRLTGYFVAGQMDGPVTAFFANGDKFQGQYNAARGDGEGFYRWASGCQAAGHWKGGCLDQLIRGKVGETPMQNIDPQADLYEI